MRKRTQSAQPSKCLFHTCNNNNCYHYYQPTASRKSFFPYFSRSVSISTSRYSPLDSAQTDLPEKICKEEKGGRKTGSPLRPCLDGAPQQKPPEARAQQRGANWGLGGNLQPFENQEKAPRCPSCFPYLPKAHLFSAVTAERPQEPPRDLLNAVENLNPGSPAECTNQTAGTQQSQPPDWSYKSLDAGSQDKGRAITCPKAPGKCSLRRFREPIGTALIRIYYKAQNAQLQTLWGRWYQLRRWEVDLGNKTAPILDLPKTFTEGNDNFIILLVTVHCA